MRTETIIKKCSELSEKYGVDKETLLFLHYSRCRSKIRKSEPLIRKLRVIK
jgi:hypothetical protein